MKLNYQTKFLDAIFSNNADQELLNLIKPAGSLNVTDALNVYREDYTARMLEALGKNYEATWVLMGDDEFTEVATRYIDSHPSSSTNLTTYGNSFPNFLANEYEHDVVVMACFEKTFWFLFNQSNNPAKIISPEELPITNFQLSESVYLFHSPYLLYQLWQKREEANSEMSLDQFEGEQYLALFKESEKVGVKEISKTQYSILEFFNETGNWELTLNNLQEKSITATEIDWAKVFEILSYAKRTKG